MIFVRFFFIVWEYKIGGIRSCENWNIVVVGKLVWDVVNKVDVLWVK